MIKRKRRINKAEIVKRQAPGLYVRVGTARALPRYLTQDKKYLLRSADYDKHGDVSSGYIVDDEGDSIFILIHGCVFLHGGSWHLTCIGGNNHD